MNSPILFFLSFASYTLGILIIFFAALAVKGKTGSAPHLIFLLAAIVYALNVFFCAFFYLSEQKAVAEFLFKLVNICGFLFAPVILHFVLTLSGMQGRSFLPKLLIIYIPFSLILYVYLFEKIFSLGSKLPTGWVVRVSEQSPWVPLIIAYWILYGGAIMVISFLWCRRASSGIRKKQASVILVTYMLSLLISFSLSMLTLVILKIENFPYISQFYTALPFIGVWYAIRRYKLLEISSGLILDDLFHRMNDFFLLTDRSGNITECNSCLATLSGFPVPELKRKGLSLQRPEGIFSLSQYIGFIEQNNSVSESLKLIPRSGDYVPIQIYGTGIRDCEGDLLGFFIMGFDLRERLMLKQETQVKEAFKNSLIDSREQYKTTIDSLKDYIFVIDKNYVVELVNRPLLEFCRKHGYANNPIGVSLFHTFPSIFGIGEEEYNKVFNGGFPVSYSKSVDMKEESFIFEVTKIPLSENLGVSRIITIIRDITERKYHESLQTKASRIDALGTMAGTISHDFNNILTCILGNVMILKDRKPDGDSSILLQEVENACEKARSLTFQLLAFSRVGELALVEGDLGSFLEEIWNSQFAEGNVFFDFSAEENLPILLFDRKQLRVVFENIFRNAVEAMPGGGRVVCLLKKIRLAWNNLQAMPSGDYLQVLIRDHGPGISPDILPKIFEPFITTKHKGNGLGLAVSFSIIKKHGAYVDVNNRPGDGCEFVLSFPLNR